MSSFNTLVNPRVQILAQRQVLTARRVLAAALLTLATAAGAWLVVPVPGTPVPITLQTFFVLAGAGLLGAGLSLSAQTAYLLLGGLGLPLLAGTALGAPTLLGVTGGYLVGFALASALVGRLLQSSRPFLGVLGTLVLGEAVILGCGALWLFVALHCSWLHAVQLGVLPFLPGDAAKLLAAAAAVRWLRPAVQKALTA